MRGIPLCCVAVIALVFSAPAQATQTRSKQKKPAKTAPSKTKKPEKKRPARATKATKKAPAKKETRYLGRKAVEKVVKYDVANLSACYKRYGLRQKRATGVLRVEIVVHKDGFVKKVEVYAPGVRGKRLGRCVFKIAKAWQFPVRKFYTRLAIPFYFHRKKVKGAGPVHSCWSAKGCPTKRRAVRKKRRKK